MLKMLLTNPVFYMSIIGMIIQLVVAGYFIYFFVKQSRKKHGDK